MRDGTPPELEVDDPPEGGWVNTQTPTVSGTVTDLGVGGVTVVVRNPDTGGETPAQVDPATGSFSVQSPPLVLAASNVIEVVATDAVGNTAKVERTVGVDQAPPEVTVFENTQWGLPGTTVTLAGTADDGQGSGVASVSVCEAGSTDACSSGSVDLTGHWSANVKAPPTEGAPANYVVRVFDHAGNEGSADATVRKRAAAAAATNSACTGGQSAIPRPVRLRGQASVYYRRATWRSRTAIGKRVCRGGAPERLQSPRSNGRPLHLRLELGRRAE